MYLTRPSSLYPVLGLSYNIFSLLQSLYRAIVVCKKWDNFFSFPFWTCILIRISLTLLQLELNFSFSFAGTVIGSSCTSPNQFIGIFAPIISSECYLLLPIKKKKKKKHNCGQIFILSIIVLLFIHSDTLFFYAHHIMTMLLFGSQYSVPWNLI